MVVRINLRAEEGRMRKKFFTPRPPMINSALRVAQDDLKLVRDAAVIRGISVSEFTRQALREKAHVVLEGRRGRTLTPN
jgi:uncharacterized protein (DUF1778 family)